MDVLELIDRLHDLVHDAKHIPLSSEVRVDKETLADLLKEMRATIPEELEEARWIVEERETRLGAEDYADEILSAFETNLSKLIAAIHRGRERLRGPDEPDAVE